MILRWFDENWNEMESPSFEGRPIEMFTVIPDDSEES